MDQLHVNGKSYDLDRAGFLLRRNQWDEDFASALAPRLGIPGGLSGEHWRVVRTIRDWFLESGHCPRIYEICRQTSLGLRRMADLFPAGYLRGACKLAGLTHLDVYRTVYREESASSPAQGPPELPVEEVELEKIYPTDILGFLDDPADWDPLWASLRAWEMGIPGGLSARHWTILRWLRDHHSEQGSVPTVYQACEALQIDLDELEQLFPNGYGRGAVKLAGLGARSGAS